MGIRGQRCAVFLDRDGVIKRRIIRGGKSVLPSHLEDLEVLPGGAKVAVGCGRNVSG
jgi:hypothetical protein